MDRESLDRVCKQIMAYYGSVKPWNTPNLMARLARDFAGYLPDKVLGAVTAWASEHPDRAPKPAELLAYMRKDQAPTTLADPERCSHPRPLAIVHEDDEGTRIGMCIRCHTEIVFKPGTLLTETETETRRLARQEAH